MAKQDREIEKMGTILMNKMVHVSHAMKPAILVQVQLYALIDQETVFWMMESVSHALTSMDMVGIYLLPMY